MKKTGLIIALLLIFAAVSGAVVTDDKELRAGLWNYNNKNYKAAVIQFKSYVERKPDPKVYYLLGYSLYKLGRFSEADENFNEAYFIDPEFSPEKAGLIKTPSGEVVQKKHARKKAHVKAPVAKTAEPAAKQPEPVAKKPVPSPSPVTSAKQNQKSSKPAPAPSATPKQISPQQQAAPAGQKPIVPPPAPATAKAPASSATPKQVSPQQQAAPAPKPVPSTPAMKPIQMPKRIPGAAAPLLVGIMAAFGMFIFIIAIVFYIFLSLCLFLIAKRLNVPAPWTAWVPLLNLWAVVGSAGKPWWWILLIFVPIVGIFVSIYLWMCITENLGKNKWLGLLILVPLVNLGFLGWLAFSKPESPASPGLE